MTNSQRFLKFAKIIITLTTTAHLFYGVGVNLH
nr:MAG TPA: hypothetical protein [Caudoviricetes sp.]